MKYQKTIVEKILQIKGSDWDKSNYLEVNDAVDDVLNQIELACKVEESDSHIQIFKEVLVLRSLVRNLTSEMHFIQLDNNEKRESIVKILSR